MNTWHITTCSSNMHKIFSFSFSEKRSVLQSFWTKKLMNWVIFHFILQNNLHSFIYHCDDGYTCKFFTPAMGYIICLHNTWHAKTHEWFFKNFMKKCKKVTTTTAKIRYFGHSQNPSKWAIEFSLRTIMLMCVVDFLYFQKTYLTFIPSSLFPLSGVPKACIGH